MAEETQQLRDLHLHGLTTLAEQLETKITALQLEMRQMFQSLLSNQAGTNEGHQDSGR
jgi:hypothetical protein